jgi:2-phosphoglycolate phosphatase
MSELLTRCAWLLDLDGTLVDSSPGVIRAFHVAQAAFGEPPADPERIRRAIGYPFAQTVAELSRVSYELFFPRFRAEAMESMHHLSRLLPGARDLLEHLARASRKLALVTSKQSDNARRILAHLQVEECFDEVIGSESVTQPKPHPEPIQIAMKRLGVLPSDSVMVGDTENDVRAARSAGIPVIALAGGFDPAERLLGADLCLFGPRGLLDLLTKAGR